MKLSNLRTRYQGVKHAGLILLMCAVSTSASAHPHPGKSAKQAKTVGDGCEVLTDPTAAERQMEELMADAPNLLNPPEYTFTDDDSAGDNPTKQAILNVEYKEPEVAGCKARLRQWAGPKYDGRPVGPTMRIGPGHTYQARITNKLPAPNPSIAKHLAHIGGHGGTSSLLGYIPPERTDINHNLSLSTKSNKSNEIDPTRFNVVNIHTHGWHVDPTDKSDNIFRTMEPGGSVNNQIVYLPTYHPSGSFWYHSHVHGSTTIQVASGMAGALIVEDPDKGLDKIEAIKNVAADRIMVFQQLAYDENGQIENYDNLRQAPYGELNRPVFINGQAYPKIDIKVGELQRWRFIHAGMTNAIKPQLVRVRNGNETTISMYEISLDGLPTGTMPSIPYAVLSSGFRTDVLVQILPSDVQNGDRFLLIDQGQKLKNGEMPNLRKVLAQIEVEIADAIPIATLPTATEISQALADYQGGDPYAPDEQSFSLLNPINFNDEPDASRKGPTQTVHYIASNPGTDVVENRNLYECPPEGGKCTYCEVQDPALCGGEQVFMFCDGAEESNPDRWKCFNFNSSAEFTRNLDLNTASEWEISGSSGNHIFHIHVNPFQVARKYVYPTDFDFTAAGMNPNELVWKDTLVAPKLNDETEPATMKTRYTRFTGAFVQHCHVLHHEDRGMMQTVSVSDPTFKHIQRVAPELYKAIMQHGKIK